MNHFRLFVIQTMLMFALISMAQQTASTPAAADKQERGQPVAQSADPVDQHLRLLSEKLGLSIDQQAKIRPILQQMFDTRQKLTQDNSLSNEAREEKERTLHEKASKQARKFLNDDQKKKLDQLEQEPHP
jgi:protein CpxP